MTAPCVLGRTSAGVVDTVNAERVRRLGIARAPLRDVVSMGDDEDAVAHDREAGPAVGEVEEAPSDRLAPDVGVLEIRRGLLRDVEDVLEVEPQLDPAGVVPVEDRPGRSSGRAMNPSSEATACTITVATSVSWSSSDESARYSSHWLNT
jgi:hypothetical protein